MAQAPVKIRRVDLYPDDFLTGTSMLDDTEFGIYARACLLIYATGGPITVDHLRAVAKSHGTTFKRCLNRLQTLGKLIVNDGQISNKRCANELERAHKRLENDAQLIHKKGEINDLQTQRAHVRTHVRSTQQPTTNNQQPTNNPPKSPHGGTRSKMNGKAKEPAYGPLRDPVEIAKELGLRK